MSPTKRKRGGASMRCPRCGEPSRVTDTRRVPNLRVIQRTRQCKGCDASFLTEERVARRPVN